MDFSSLIAPFDKHEFEDKYWSKAPLRIARQAPSFYENLLSEPDLEFILQSAARVPRALEILAEGDRVQRPQSHQHAISAFQHGKSLRVDAIQRFSRPILTLARSLELAIGCPINVNLYLTPGAGKKALSRHFDTHDVFVLQIFGNKIWRLYDSPVSSPLEHLPLQRRESIHDMREFRLRNSQSGRDLCNLTEEFTLTPGDMLYLPRGFWHEAESEPGKVSCHLTVGVQPTTYLDLFSVALAGAAESMPLLRTSLPYGFTVREDSQTAMEETVKTILQDLPERLPIRESIGQIASIFLRSHKVGLENHLLASADGIPQPVDSDTALRVAHAVVFGLDVSQTPVRLVCGSKIFEIAAPYEEACRAIAINGEFVPSVLPGSISLDEKVILCRQLVSEGILAVATPLPVTTDPIPEKPRWVPTQVDLRKGSVSWIDLADRPFTEPFMHQTVRRFQESSPGVKKRATALGALKKVEEQMRPSGFIFHISRCGSTLLSNSMKYFDNTFLVSEPQPVGALLELLSRSSSDQETRRAQELLRGLIRAYGQRRVGTEEHFLLKFSSWNILHLDTIRKLWSDVPTVILVRDPLEVAVSCIEAPPGWMHWKKSNLSAVTKTLGIDRSEAEAISVETFCARMLGRFLDFASRGKKSGCTVVDYRDLNLARIETVARDFGISVTASALQQVSANFSNYSKDPEKMREHKDDSELKKSRATEALREAIDRHARPAYEALQ